MRRTKILNAQEVKRMSYSEAQSSYFKHCRLKNLRPQTITYYKEDTDYFQAKTGVKYADCPFRFSPLLCPIFVDWCRRADKQEYVNQAADHHVLSMHIQ
jgi:hypothetical protein